MKNPNTPETSILNHLARSLVRLVSLQPRLSGAYLHQFRVLFTNEILDIVMNESINQDTANTKGIYLPSLPFKFLTPQGLEEAISDPFYENRSDLKMNIRKLYLTCLFDDSSFIKNQVKFSVKEIESAIKETNYNINKGLDRNNDKGNKSVKLNILENIEKHFFTSFDNQTFSQSLKHFKNTGMSYPNYENILRQIYKNAFLAKFSENPLTKETFSMKEYLFPCPEKSLCR